MKINAFLKKTIVQWLLYAGGTLALGGLGGLLGGTTGFDTLQKPPLTPPAWAFPVVWSALYLLMGTAAFLISRTAAYNRTGSLWLYWIQVLVNALWPVLFFRLSLRLFALIWLLTLLLLVIILTIAFYRIRKNAAALLLPYIVWLLYAAYLNFGFYVLN
jgi:tryptophan-rich sensory protein